jgi:hypothetical protein
MTTTKPSIDPEINLGTIHELPEVLKNTLLGNSELLEKWNNLTPLARNEYILSDHKRPCCWPGCPHHRPDAAKWF